MTEIEQKEAEVTKESVPESTENPVKSASAPVKKSNVKFYIGAFLLVFAVIVVVLFQLEKEGRSSTTFFSGYLAEQEAGQPVVVVNGEEIVNSELEVSIDQFSQMALAQGVDLSSEVVQTQIREEALNVLVNTELLKQEAVKRGIEISEEDVDSRLESIVQEVGSEELFAERMGVLGLTADQLREDVREELVIQILLDQLFVESGVAVTEEEVNAVYESASGQQEDLPALEEVRAQVEAQISAAKEQEALDGFIAELRESATIEEIE